MESKWRFMNSWYVVPDIFNGVILQQAITVPFFWSQNHTLTLLLTSVIPNLKSRDRGLRTLLHIGKTEIHQHTAYTNMSELHNYMSYNVRCFGFLFLKKYIKNHTKKLKIKQSVIVICKCFQHKNNLL